jgi:transmembrane sensor
MVSFRGETLREVLAELNRYNSVPLTASDETAANLRISGYFRATDVPTFLARLEGAFPVRVERTPERVTIHSR